MSDSIIISITKDKILINGIECTNDNFEKVFSEVGIGSHEAKQIIMLISAKMFKKGGVFKRE